MAYVLLSSVADAAAKIASSVRNLDVGSSSPSSTRDLPRKIQEDARRLSRMVKRIRALLEDAEEREIKDKSVRFWLRELEGVAYDAEDVLEELQYEMLSPQMEGHGLPAAGHTGAQIGCLNGGKISEASVVVQVWTVLMDDSFCSSYISFQIEDTVTGDSMHSTYGSRLAEGNG